MIVTMNEKREEVQLIKGGYNASMCTRLINQSSLKSLGTYRLDVKVIGSMFIAQISREMPPVSTSHPSCLNHLSL